MVQALTVPLPVSAIAVLLAWTGHGGRTSPSGPTTSPHCSGSHSADLTLVTGRALPNIPALRNLIDGEMRAPTNPTTSWRSYDAPAPSLMSPVEAPSAAMLLLVAGNETTTNLLGSI